MRFKPKFALLLLAPLLLGACNGMLDSTNDNSKDLSEIRYTVRLMYEAQQRILLITPAGELTIIEEKPNAAPRKIVTEITPEEKSKLIAAFQGWKKLKDSYSVDVSPQVVINYGGKAVTTSRPDLVPEPFARAKDALDKIAIAISAEADKRQAAATATAPATSAAPATSTAPAK